MLQYYVHHHVHVISTSGLENIEFL